MVSLVAVVLSLLAINAGSMKTHQTGNQTFDFDLSKIKSQTCAEARRAAVNNMIDDLERSKGFDAVFYRGCVKFVADNADGKHKAAAQTEKLGQACKKGMFDGHNSVLTKVDPSKLAEECDRAVYQMDMQLKILGPDSFQTSKDFCAVFVDLVLPIDEEPDCMRFVEDITHAHYDFAGTMHHWPRITKEKHFDEAFMRVCLEDKKLEMEEKGYEVVWGSGSDECRLLLERIMAAKWAHYNKLSEFFAYACPVMGKPLPQPSDKSFDPATATKRSMATQLFHRASHIAHSAANYSNATVQLFEPRRKKFSAMQLMDDALDESVSAKSPRRRRLTTNERVCCSGKAYNWELGVAAGSSITVSASVSLAAGGFNAWEDKTCVFEKSNIHEVCLNWDFGVDMDGPLEIDVSVARGWFKSYGDMLGRSTFVGANACFIFCIGGSVIQAMNGDVIGGTVEFGFGFPGVDFEGGICQCTKNSGYQKLRFHGLKDRCPSGCFPEDAMVQTAQGSKNMSDLRVGDHVLTVNTAGDLVFEEIYFFGHADPKAFSPMVQLLIQDSNSTASMIELSPDHFLHTCPELRPCLWSQSTAAYAATVVEGAYVWAATDSLNIGRVVSSRFVPKRGLYNPYTLSGNIVVNGVAASAHSSWVLDPWTPDCYKKYLPSIYQAIFVVGRLLYHTFGPQAAEWIGVNNPHEQTPFLAYAVASSSLSLMLVVPAMFGLLWKSLRSAQAKL